MNESHSLSDTIPEKKQDIIKKEDTINDKKDNSQVSATFIHSSNASSSPSVPILSPVLTEGVEEGVEEEAEEEDISQHHQEKQHYNTDINNNDFIGKNTTDTNENNNHTTTNNRTTNPKRVKVYILENNEWKDVGTGYCTGELLKTTNHDTNTSRVTNDNTTTANTHNGGNEDEQIDEAYLLVHDEKFPDVMLLKSKIEGNVEYQRQEETLIVWKDLLKRDIALSFEESNGCDHVCEFIVNVQMNLVHSISLVAVKSDLSNNSTVHEIIAGPVNLPTISPDQNCCDLLTSLKYLNENLSYIFLKNETISFILASNYIELLIKLFNKAESCHLLKNLLLLSSIMKTLFIYNEKVLIERILEDSNFDSILGILEYDTDYPTMRANHRATFHSIFIKQHEKFNQWFKYNTNSLFKEVILKTCKLIFLKDVALVRFLDDFPIICDLIQEYQTFIIDYMTNGSEFLDKILGIFSPRDDSVDNGNTKDANNSAKWEALNILHQCILMTKNSFVEHSEKSEFFHKLVTSGLFKVLYFAFDTSVSTPDSITINTTHDKNHTDTSFSLSDLESMRILATDIIIAIIDHDVLLINNSSASAAGAMSYAEQQQNSIGNINYNKSAETTLPLLQKIDDYNTDIDTSKLSNDMTLLMILSKLLVEDKNICLKEQILQALLTLLHPDGNDGAEDFLTSNSNSCGNNNNYTEDNYNMDDNIEEDNLGFVTTGTTGSSNLGDFGSSDNDTLFGDINENDNMDATVAAITNNNTNKNTMYVCDNTDIIMDDNEMELKNRDLKVDYFEMFDFLNAFYKEVAPILFGPLISLELCGTKGNSSFTYQDNLLMLYLIKLVNFIAVIHQRHISRNFILENHILIKISQLVNNKNVTLQLKLSCIRCLKNIIELDDTYYIRYIISKNLLTPVFALLSANMFKDNLCTSTILDLLKKIVDHSEASNSRLLNRYIVGNFRDCLIGVNYSELSDKMFNMENEKQLIDPVQIISSKKTVLKPGATSMPPSKASSIHHKRTRRGILNEQVIYSDDDSANYDDDDDDEEEGEEEDFYSKDEDIDDDVFSRYNLKNKERRLSDDLKNYNHENHNKHSNTNKNNGNNRNGNKKVIKNQNALSLNGNNDIGDGGGSNSSSNSGSENDSDEELHPIKQRTLSV
ncbi:Psy2p SCDLUD_003001 [Saccharomycodes ludwigii]|uniref:Psy2p n=1 Tax=Saccharomycodes ludwigii TaxID=36035 RepID=UPI001E886A57|nr:hypothetical protein SCDLUD_003001 [Saccharomycodes ludwigii]KAH3901505.1 hypothetical protein SCDLUD_003001 [Saccharomycodes ludwigii]